MIKIIIGVLVIVVIAIIGLYWYCFMRKAAADEKRCDTCLWLDKNVLPSLIKMGLQKDPLAVKV